MERSLNIEATKMYDIKSDKATNIPITRQWMKNNKNAKHA